MQRPDDCPVNICWLNEEPGLFLPRKHSYECKFKEKVGGGRWQFAPWNKNEIEFFFFLWLISFNRSLHQLASVQLCQSWNIRQLEKRFSVDKYLIYKVLRGLKKWKGVCRMGVVFNTVRKIPNKRVCFSFQRPVGT